MTVPGYSVYVNMVSLSPGESKSVKLLTNTADLNYKIEKVKVQFPDGEGVKVAFSLYVGNIQVLPENEGEILTSKESEYTTNITLGSGSTLSAKVRNTDSSLPTSVQFVLFVSKGVS